MSGKKGGGGGGAKGGLTLQSNITAVPDAPKTPLLKKVFGAVSDSGGHILGVLGAAALSALLDHLYERFNAQQETAGKAKLRPSPPGTERHDLEHMFDMSVRNVQAKGRGDVKKVMKEFLHYNADLKSWEPLEEEIREYLRLVETGDVIVKPPKKTK